MLISDTPHMQNHLLKVTREVEKFEFHGFRIGIYTDFYSFAFKERKMFSAVKKSLQQMGLSHLFLFLVGLWVNYPGHSYKFEIIGTAEG